MNRRSGDWRNSIANLKAIASHNDLEIQQRFKPLELKDHQE